MTKETTYDDIKRRIHHRAPKSQAARYSQAALELAQMAEKLGVGLRITIKEGADPRTVHNELSRGLSIIIAKILQTSQAASAAKALAISPSEYNDTVAKESLALQLHRDLLEIARRCRLVLRVVERARSLFRREVRETVIQLLQSNTLDDAAKQKLIEDYSKVRELEALPLLKQKAKQNASKRKEALTEKELAELAAREEVLAAMSAVRGGEGMDLERLTEAALKLDKLRGIDTHAEEEDTPKEARKRRR